MMRRGCLVRRSEGPLATVLTRSRITSCRKVDGPVFASARRQYIYGTVADRHIRRPQRSSSPSLLDSAMMRVLLSFFGPLGASHVFLRWIDIGCAGCAEMFACRALSFIMLLISSSMGAGTFLIFLPGPPQRFSSINSHDVPSLASVASLVHIIPSEQ